MSRQKKLGTGLVLVSGCDPAGSNCGGATFQGSILMSTDEPVPLTRLKKGCPFLLSKEEKLGALLPIVLGHIGSANKTEVC